MEENTDTIKSNLVLKYHFTDFLSKFESNLLLYADHMGMYGKANEKILADYLRLFLPSKYKIETNVKLVSFGGVTSPEQDLIIWNYLEMPRIFADHNIFLTETVSATIEVKTKLNASTLRLAIENIKKAKQTAWKDKTPVNINGAFQNNDFSRMERVNPPLSIIFAYDCEWKYKKTLYDNLKEAIKEIECEPDELFDFIYILKPGIEIAWNDMREDYIFTGSRRTRIIPRSKTFLPFNFPSAEKEKLFLLVQQITPKLGSDPKKFGEITDENQIKFFLFFLKKMIGCFNVAINMPITSIIHMCWKYSRSGIGSGGGSVRIWGEKTDREKS